MAGPESPVYVKEILNPKPVALALLDAARSMGMPTFDSPNGEMMEGRVGSAIKELIVKEGRRSSIYRLYVHQHLTRKT